MNESHASARAAGLLAVLVFVVVSLLGVAVHGDYGLAWDEPAQRELGRLTYEYAFHGDQSLLAYRDRDYGPAAELPLMMVERVMGDSTTRRVFLTRHLAVFVFFAGGAGMLAALVARRTDWRWGALAAAMLVTSPRIFADAFYNSKDIPFLVGCVASLLTAHLLLDRRSVRWALVHAVVTGWTIDVRILGVFIPVFTVGLLALEYKDVPLRRRAILTAWYLMATVLTVVAFWPAIWSSPITGFAEAFRRMSAFPFDLATLYRGQLIPAQELPRTYGPVWMAITTPLIYLGVILLGVLTLMWRARAGRRALDDSAFRRDLAICAWGLGPLAAIIVLHSPIYDGWRHLFFVYAPLIATAVVSFAWLLSPDGTSRIRGGRGVVLAAVAVVATVCQVGGTAWQMMAMHPFENVYFNAMGGNASSRRSQYEQDYWGLSSRQLLEWLAVHEPSRPILFMAAAPPGELNVGFLPDSLRARLQLATPEQAQFFITNFRAHPAEYGGTKVYSLVVGGAEIGAIYRRD